MCAYNVYMENTIETLKAEAIWVHNSETGYSAAIGNVGSWHFTAILWHRFGSSPRGHVSLIDKEWGLIEYQHGSTKPVTAEFSSAVAAIEALCVESLKEI